MDDKELYHGFDMTKQEEYEKYLVKYYGLVAEDLIHESKKRTISWGTQEWADLEREGNKIYKAMAECIDQELGPRSDAVQALVLKHFHMTERFYDMTKDVYIGLAQLYCEHPGFKKFFDQHHPKLVDFIAEAMRFYAQNRMA